MLLPFSAGSLGSSVLDLERWGQVQRGARVASESTETE